MMGITYLHSLDIYIKDKQYIYVDGNLVVSKFPRQTNFMDVIQPCRKFTPKFATFDLDTRTIDGVMIPYCVSVYDGMITKSFYLSDFLSVDLMLIEAVLFFNRRKYNGYRIYIHNFIYFDGIFLMSILASLSSHITPIIRGGRIIDFRINLIFIFALLLLLKAIYTYMLKLQ